MASPTGSSASSAGGGAPSKQRQKRQQQKQQKQASHRLAQFLWNTWCVVSVAGIWPRFIEPRLLETTRITLPLPQLPQDLDGLRIVQFSDLHIGQQMSQSFLHKLSDRILSLRPHLILFTGDFLCYSHLDDPTRLKDFLCSLQAPLGCYAVLGNHDYDAYAALNRDGVCGIVDEVRSPLIAGFSRLLFAQKTTKYREQSIPPVTAHEELCSLLADTPFRQLENDTVQVKVGRSGLNVCGLGDCWAGNFHPQTAFDQYDPAYPGIVCSHNPDTAAELQKYPGSIILSGHTHGGQVNIPWLRNRFLGLHDKKLYRGLYQLADKPLYVNRGVGSVFKFRWFSKPELLLLTLGSCL